MIITYQEFCDLTLKLAQTGQDFFELLLKKVINNPSRYCGLFRLSNAKTKLIQNVTQSREIIFGDIMEELTTQYLDRLGYQNYDKHLGVDENGDALNADQFFTDGNTLYLVEMKIRDDHDSTKKRGQFANFVKKINLIKTLYPSTHLDASMWFVDDGLKKNKRYYTNEMARSSISNCSLHLYYGDSFFNVLNGGAEAWSELTSILTDYRIENINTDVEIPDFGTSDEIYKALLSLSSKNWNKLTSDDPQYVLLRQELFSSGDNIEKARIERIRRLTQGHR